MTISPGPYITKLTCRFCNHFTRDILHLGDRFGLAGGFVTPQELQEKEYYYPLTLSLCDHCKYIQCKQLISPDQLFKKNYFYYSSMIPSLVKHFQQLSQFINARFPLTTKIIEIGCNDGVLLHPLFQLGYRHCIGVDPSQTIEKVDSSIPTYQAYFNKETADKILKTHGVQDLFISCNSFAHIDNMQEILYHMKRVLHPQHGKAIIEIHYSKYIFQDNQFDFIYHEHMGYYTVTSLVNICKEYNLSLSHVEIVPNHGGSLRCMIDMQPTSTPPPSHIQNLLTQEALLFQGNFFSQYQKTIEQWKKDLQDLLHKLTTQNKTVYGYGASGRANTLLHFAEITLPAIIDDAPSKIGSYTPLYNIPIVNSSILYSSHPPDYVLLLAWPYASYIMEQHKHYSGTFIVPLPAITLNDTHNLPKDHTPHTH